MTVKSILEGKGNDVATLRAKVTVAEAVKLLADMRIGAVVITDGDGRIEGILSERDVVRAIAAEGAAALARPVAELMTSPVRTCREDNSVNDVMQEMTRRRFRHLPVERNGRLVGIVSIGDVVKRRIEDVEREAKDIREYIVSAG